nr:hypothetical protein JG1_0230 [uncultured bacterium]
MLETKIVWPINCIVVEKTSDDVRTSMEAITTRIKRTDKDYIKK